MRLQAPVRRVLPLVVALVVVTGLVAAACGGSDGATGESAAGGSGTDAESEVGVIAPTADGGQLAFGDLVGKPALLWFWAPW